MKRMVDEKVVYEGWDYLKFVALESKTVADVIASLEGQIAILRGMEKDEVEIDLENIGEGHLNYSTEDIAIAEKYGFVHMEDDGQGNFSVTNTKGESVLEESETMWTCRCDCGREVIVSESDLLSGRVTSCGQCDNGEKV